MLMFSQYLLFTHIPYTIINTSYSNVFCSLLLGCALPIIHVCVFPIPMHALVHVPANMLMHALVASFGTNNWATSCKTTFVFMEVLQRRKCVLWLAEHLVGNAFIERSSLHTLHACLQVRIPLMQWSRLIAPVLVIDGTSRVSVCAVQDLLSINNAQWSDMLRQAKDMLSIDIASDDDHEQADAAALQMVPVDVAALQMEPVDAAALQMVPVEALQ